MGQPLHGVGCQRAEPITGPIVRSVRRLVHLSCRRHEENQFESVRNPALIMTWLVTNLIFTAL